jgi:hypothetical protein
MRVRPFLLSSIPLQNYGVTNILYKTISGGGGGDGDVDDGSGFPALCSGYLYFLFRIFHNCKVTLHLRIPRTNVLLIRNSIRYLHRYKV